MFDGSIVLLRLNLFPVEVAINQANRYLLDKEGRRANH
jgi:hypothetical protein